MFSYFTESQPKAVDYGTTLSNILVFPGGKLAISTVGDSRVMLLKIKGKKTEQFWSSKDTQRDKNQKRKKYRTDVRTVLVWST
eukprot:TRINITY_DN3088_c0_g1_i1.p2 TRINITY_DN3088_c0_g1~~TRINITY_DN3088_c0_g1_i1.p2  ORF type:complete len:83 (-),score=11.12 TRINITY_DN3088_c0_g1_i1:11-259(-)